MSLVFDVRSPVCFGAAAAFLSSGMLDPSRRVHAPGVPG
jgi:hypothetical protein